VACAQAARAMLAYLAERNARSGIKWEMRIGIHSGSVIAGVVGSHKFTYDAWGDTVNIASRLESASEGGCISVSAYTYERIRHRFACQYRGKVELKGKGSIDVYYVGEPLETEPPACVPEG
jgi:adenylate cyclase